MGVEYVGFALGALGFLVGTIEKGVGATYKVKDYQRIRNSFYIRLSEIKGRLQAWQHLWLVINPENVPGTISDVERLNWLWGRSEQEQITSILTMIDAETQGLLDVLKNPQGRANKDSRAWQSYLDGLQIESAVYGSRPPKPDAPPLQLLDRMALALWKNPLLEDKTTRLSHLVNSLVWRSDKAYWAAAGKSGSSESVSQEEIARFDMIQARATRLWRLSPPSAQSSSWALLFAHEDMPERPCDLLAKAIDELELHFVFFRNFDLEQKAKRFLIRYRLDVDSDDYFRQYDECSPASGSITDSLKTQLMQLSPGLDTRERKVLEPYFARAAMCIAYWTTLFLGSPMTRNICSCGIRHIRLPEGHEEPVYKERSYHHQACPCPSDEIGGKHLQLALILAELALAAPISVRVDENQELMFDLSGEHLDQIQLLERIVYARSISYKNAVLFCLRIRKSPQHWSPPDAHAVTQYTKKVVQPLVDYYEQKVKPQLQIQVHDYADR